MKRRWNCSTAGLFEEKIVKHQNIKSCIQGKGKTFFLIHLQEREKNKEKFLTPHGASLPARRRWGDSDFSISCNSPPMLGRVFSKCRTHLWPDGLVVSNYYVVVDPELCEVALALVCISGANPNNAMCGGKVLSYWRLTLLYRRMQPHETLAIWPMDSMNFLQINFQSFVGYFHVKEWSFVRYHCDIQIE